MMNTPLRRSKFPTTPPARLRSTGVGSLAWSAPWLLAWVLTACTPAGDAPPPAATANAQASQRLAPHPDDSDALLLEKGKAVVAQAFSVLASNLQSALAAGGTSHAISFCSVEALPLTETVGRDYAVELRRVSHQVRNPKNTPDDEEASVLESFRAAMAAGQPVAPRLQRRETEAVLYAPILLSNPLCLTCHGEPQTEIAPDTLALLDRLYPADQATGFKLNELRGMWVVKLTPTAGAAAQ